MSDREQRTEKPTPRRLREARREGQVARSPELAGWTALLAGSLLLQLTVRSGGHLVRELLADATQVVAEPDSGRALHLLGRGLAGGLVAVLPIVLGLTALGVASNLAQVGFVASAKAFKPKFDRVNPLAGMKRLLSPVSLWEAAKATLKLLLMGELVRRSLVAFVPTLMGGGLAAPQLAAAVAGAGLRLLRNAALAGLLIAAGDYALQRQRRTRNLRMTKQQVKEEMKQAEGNPQVKGAIRARQLRLSRQRMLAAVAGADVIVVNPTHYAVALAYQPSRGAPRVVAKGVDKVAARIREEAERHGVPMVVDPPLARTLHRACELGDEVPAALYEAVARVLAFVYALRSRGPAVSNTHRLPLPAAV